MDDFERNKKIGSWLRKQKILWKMSRFEKMPQNIFAYSFLLEDFKHFCFSLMVQVKSSKSKYNLIREAAKKILH